jgi:hypothetical protein
LFLAAVSDKSARTIGAQHAEGTSESAIPDNAAPPLTGTALRFRQHEGPFHNVRIPARARNTANIPYAKPETANNPATALINVPNEMYTKTTPPRKQAVLMLAVLRGRPEQSAAKAMHRGTAHGPALETMPASRAAGIAYSLPCAAVSIRIPVLSNIYELVENPPWLSYFIFVSEVAEPPVMLMSVPGSCPPGHVIV